MPEGPEVKIASDYFNNFFFSSKKINFEIISDYYNKKYSNVFNVISSNLKKFIPSYTIGKNIFINLENNHIFNLHLGMTGGWSSELVKHCHFRIFDKNNELFFRDVRKFGNLKIIDRSFFNQKFNTSYDLLSSAYNIQQHLDFLNSKISTKKSICSILMDQKYFPGVGNYIKSESLYAAKIHPEEKWGNLNTKMKMNLINNTKEIIYNSYKSGGAELRDFKNPFHSSKFILQIYGKDFTSDNREVISAQTSDSRKTWFCPDIQKLV